MLPNNCTERNRCGNARTCQRCAAKRQAKIADAADQLERQHGQLTLTVLRPDLNTQDEIRRVRANFIRRALTPAGLWTVESGTEFAGLHINILSPKPAPTRWLNCKTYSELVRCTSREAAAYISKRAGLPPLEQYSGNMYGTFGQLAKYLASTDAPPVIQAATLEHALSGTTAKFKPQQATTNTKYLPATAEHWEPDEQKFNPDKPREFHHWFPELSNPPWKRREKTLAERREIMQRHLPNIYAIINTAKQPCAGSALPGDASPAGGGQR